MKLVLYFGAITDSVSDQVSKQCGERIELPDFDKDAKALVRCHVRGIITESEVQKARKRLMKKITRYLNAHPRNQVLKGE